MIMNKEWNKKKTKVMDISQPFSGWHTAYEYWCKHLKDLNGTYFIVYSSAHRLADKVCPICVKRYKKGEARIDIYKKLEAYEVPQYMGEYTDYQPPNKLTKLI